MDDIVNTEIAEEMGCLVIALDYSKSPHAKYPVAIYEIIATILEILEDETLLFNRDRVVLAGYSAGATLALSAAQSSKLRGNIHGIVAFYPMTEFITSAADRAATRPYTTGETDPLFSQLELIRYAYVSKDQNAQEVWKEGEREKWCVEDDGIKWVLMKKAKHGFTHYLGGDTDEMESKRRLQAEECFEMVYQWLKEGPFAEKR